MNKHVHIVCPDIPLPSSGADMLDVLHQISCLHHAGYAIVLHCFHQEEDIDPDIGSLSDITQHIHLYTRNEGHKGVSMKHPYCVSSRCNPQLLENLLQAEYPVLFQGMAATYYLPDLAEKGYTLAVRINGIASELYDASVKSEKSLFKKAYSFNEARLIKKWEEKISEQAVIITTTANDRKKFHELYNGAEVICLSPFMPAPAITSKPGTGMYCLYYGDLSNHENEKALKWLTDNVFSKIAVPLVVADTCTTPITQEDNHRESHICTVSNPASTELMELIQKAQLVLLPRCHNKGFDKRLLQALETGRFCICNDYMAEGTGLEKLFIIANDNGEMIDIIDLYFSRSFTEEDIKERTTLLNACLTPQDSLHTLVKVLEQKSIL